MKYQASVEFETSGRFFFFVWALFELQIQREFLNRMSLKVRV